MKSLAKFFNHNFDNGYFRMYNNNGDTIYHEDLNGFWIKEYFNGGGRKKIYCEYLDGFWWKQEFNGNGKKVYLEDSKYGVIFDKRSKSCDGKVVEIDGKKYQLKEV